MPEQKSNYLGDLYWKDLTPEQVSSFYQEYKGILLLRYDFATKTSVELTKYLLTINSGMAAGLFYLLNNGYRGQCYLASFYLFCAGAFFVGLAYFLIASWAFDVTNGTAANLTAWGHNKITMRKMDEMNSSLIDAGKKKWGQRCVGLSFALLVAGGLLAGVPFWNGQGRPAEPAKVLPVQRL